MHAHRVQQTMLSCWVNAFREQRKLEWAHIAARELLAKRFLLDWKAESEKTRHRYKTSASRLLLPVYTFMNRPSCYRHSVPVPVTVSTHSRWL